MSTGGSQASDIFLAPRLPGRIPSLDGLRAISIALVMVGHSADCNNAPRILAHFGHLGNFGVRCFFVISGFLITTLLLKEREKTGSISMKGFYIRRALRIFPPSLAYIGIIAICYGLGWLILYPGDLAHALTYTMNYHVHRAWWLDHLWSLSVEEQFYILWPGLIWLAGPRRGLKAAWGVVFVVPVIRAIMWFVFHASDSAMTKHFEANADALSTGCLLSMNFNWLSTIRWYQRFQSSWLFWIVALGCVFGGHGLFAVNPASFYIVGQSIANLGTVLCVDWAVRNYNSAVGHFLNWGPIVYVGALSYSLYLWQNAFLNPIWNAWPAMLPVNILLAFGLATVSYYVVEQPFLRLKRSPSSTR
jgi:peptidoglycan/LPS O-acetylase OafA/YrhL